MGGAQYQIKCLVEEALKQEKYEITFVARNYDRSYQPAGYQIIPLAEERDKRRGLPRFISDYRNLKQILSNLKPDVVYQRVGCSLTGSVAYLAQSMRFKLIWHVASEVDVTPFKFKLSRYLISNFIEKKIMEFGIKHIEDIVVQTEDQAQLLTQNYGRKYRAVIPNFHPFPEEAINKSDPVKIVWLANLKSLKQPEAFIKLAQALIHEKNARFIMIGAMQGSTEWRQKLLSDIDNLDNLDYVGPKTQDEVNEILSSSHILVNTSQYEGFSNTFIQAWMREMPVVSLNVNPDRIFDKQPIGFHAKTAENLIKKVKILIHDQELRYSMGGNAKRYAFQNHSLKNVDMLLNLFNERAKNS